MKLIEDKITDRRFTHLIRKCLKAGYLDFTTHKTNIIGSPQGNIISPILANIYLHELDKRIVGLFQNFNTGKCSPVTKEYRKYSHLIFKFKREGKFDDLRKINKLRRTVAVHDFKSDKFKVLKYVRYADAFLIGVKGSHNDCKTVLEDVKMFMDDLKINMNTDKSKIINLNSEHTEFLGTRFRRFQHQLYVKSYEKGNFIKKRGARGIRFEAPVEEIRHKLASLGFIAKNKPSPRLI